MPSIMVMMPLHDFPYLADSDFQFGCGPYSIRKLDRAADLDMAGLSEMDRVHIKMEKWALYAEDPPKDYRIQVNMLLLAMRIQKRKTPFIKFRICAEDDRHCGMMGDIYGPVKPQDASAMPCESHLFSESDLRWVDTATTRLMEMDQVSNRTHNALYFLYRGCVNRMWVDSFMLWMSALESLFSEDTRGGVTKLICGRTSKFLNSRPGVSYADIDHLYDLRSQMVHGRLPITEDPKANIEELASLESIVLDCLERFIDESAYTHYGEPSARKAFLAQFD